jgi:hypothetical protein
LRVFSHALQRLQVAAERAVEVLEKVMRDEEASSAAWIHAAAAVLPLGH